MRREEIGRQLNPYYVVALDHEDVEDDYSEDSDASCGESDMQLHRRNY